MSLAFIAPPQRIQTHSDGKLQHFTFAVKDLIDVKGFVTGGGNPTWERTHNSAQENAPCVSQLLQQGATYLGKTISDELAYSLEGRNHFFGTPLNPLWPSVMPGGSSSGSASAVAQQLVDFALGTDTGGSVRVPAAFCGVWGIRPTFNRISLDGVLPFASCFDTVGWFAHELATFIEVGKVLLKEDQYSKDLKDLTLCGVEEAFSLREQSNPQQANELLNFAKKMGMQNNISIFNGEEKSWLECYQYLQDASIKQNLGAWISQNSPEFGPQMKINFERVMQNDCSKTAFYQTRQAQITQQIDIILENNILILPTTPVALLDKHISNEDLSIFYQNSLTMNAISGLAGVPQISIPVQNTAEYPIALSVIGPRHSDQQLLQFAKALFLKVTP